MTESDRIQSIKKHGGRHLQNFKEENITYGMCLAAVESDGTAIYFVPNRYRNEEIYRAVCRSFGSFLQYIPKQYVCQEICELAVCSDGKALQYVPESLKTPELCFQAACSDPIAFRFTPSEILTPDFCAMVVQKKGADSINALPNSYKNTKFYSAVIDKAPEIFWVLPKKSRTASICRTAIEKMGYSSTAEAVQNQPHLFELLHESLYDHDACLAFVKSDWFKLSVSELWFSYSRTRQSICGNELVIFRHAIPLDKLLRYDDVYELAVQENNIFLEAVPSMESRELKRL